MADSPRRHISVSTRGDPWRYHTVQGHRAVPIQGEPWRYQTVQRHIAHPPRLNAEPSLFSVTPGDTRQFKVTLLILQDCNTELSLFRVTTGHPTQFMAIFQHQSQPKGNAIEIPHLIHLTMPRHDDEELS